MLLKSIFALQFLAISLTAASPITSQNRSTEYEKATLYQTRSAHSTAASKCYKGIEFPPANEWLSFDKLWALNTPVMLKFDSKAEVKAIRKYIIKAAAVAGINKSILLATMMQESNGNVRSKAGDGVTPGLLQALGSTSCLGTKFGKCPASKIKDMIMAGALGTHKTQGLASCFEKNHRRYGPMLRCYNSGSVIDPFNLGLVKFGTPSYVSDIANRLKGAKPRSDCGWSVAIPSPGY